MAEKLSEEAENLSEERVPKLPEFEEPPDAEPPRAQRAKNNDPKRYITTKRYVPVATLKALRNEVTTPRPATTAPGSLTGNQVIGELMRRASGTRITRDDFELLRKARKR